jgi:hypothetical protein
MRLLLIVAVSVFLPSASALASAPTAASSGTGVSAQPAEEHPAKKERMVCKTEKFVGSHLSQRICMTETEWQVGKENAKAALDARGRGADNRSPGVKAGN